MEAFFPSVERDSTCLVLCLHLSAAAALDIELFKFSIINRGEFRSFSGNDFLNKFYFFMLQFDC